ncbi:MAG: hypothetical protein IKM31_00555 [Oscillospiraceae bacterium]|nr:hypothetical protein [Oscillospiraceae bacterium]
MKIAMIVYLFVALFGSGFAFLRLNSHFAGRRFVLNMKNAAASVWVSVLFSVMSGMLHHNVILLGEHLIFDALGAVFFAVMTACGVALVRELCFAGCKKQQRTVRRHSRVIPFPASGVSASVSDRKTVRTAA